MKPCLERAALALPTHMALEQKQTTDAVMMDLTSLSSSHLND